MPVVIELDETKHISSERIDWVAHEPWWTFRNVSIETPGFEEDSPQLEMLRELLPHVAEYVESFEIDAFASGSAAVLTAMASSFASTRPIRLKRITLDDFGTANMGDTLLPALQGMPYLEEITIRNANCFSSSSPPNVEQFLATTSSLKTLVLYDLTAPEEVATAFRQGLRRNETITKIELRGVRDGPFLPACLLGIMGNNHVQELKLHLIRGARPYTALEETRLAVRALIAGTTSIQKLSSIGSHVLMADLFNGLTSNSSVEEIEFEVDGNRNMDPQPPLDLTLAGAIQEFSVNNRTLRICKIHGVGGQFGPRSRASLASALSHMNALEVAEVDGLVITPNALLPHVTKFQTISLRNLSVCQGTLLDWRLLAQGFGFQNWQRQNNLQVLDLSFNRLTTQNLQMILLNLPRSVVNLDLSECGIVSESVPLICGFIRSSRVRKLRLGTNPLGAQGAGAIFEAGGGSASMEHLAMEGPIGDDEGNERDPRSININACHESLQTLLATSRLVSLDVRHFAHLGIDCIRSIAAGLRHNGTLKSIRLPWLNLEHVAVIGDALTVNRSLESIEVYSGQGLSLEDLVATEEESVLSFIRFLPQMKSMTCIKGLFDFNPSTQVLQTLIGALKENTTLTEVTGGYFKMMEASHMCHNETVRFYLQMNRLGRHHYVTIPESKPIPVGVLPHLYARVSSGPEFASHLYYFVRHTSPDLLVGQQAMMRKRRPLDNSC